MTLLDDPDSIKVGWKAGPEQYPPTDLLEYAITAERVGFDLVEASDHFHPWSEAGQASFVWTWLGAVASRTTTIHIGTGVTCPILRYHPSIIAQASATVGALAPGRTYLGVGTGEALNEYAATGMWPDYDEREERLGEAIDLIRFLWTGDQVTFTGDYYETREAKLYTVSPHQIPLYISSMVPESSYFAGCYGDGLITTGGKQPDEYKQLIKNFEEGARESDKDPETMPLMIELSGAYTEDTEGAIRCTLQYWAGAQVPAMFDQKIYTPAMSAKNGQVVGADFLKSKMCISGDPEEHIKWLKKYVDLGFTQLIFHSAGPDQKDMIERYGRDVLPHIREESA